MKKRIVRFLLRLYPASWRVEYGQELASILEGRRLSAAVVFDTLRSAMVERMRVSEPWVLIGSLLFVLNFCATAINSVIPLRTPAYQIYEWLVWMPLIIGICWTTVRGAGLRMTAVAALKMALLGNATDLLLLVLWAIGIVHPGVIGLSDLPAISGFRVTLLSFRSTLPVPIPAGYLVWQVPLAPPDTRRGQRDRLVDGDARGSACPRDDRSLKRRGANLRQLSKKGQTGFRPPQAGACAGGITDWGQSGQSPFSSGFL